MAPKEQPPRKLSGPRTVVINKLWKAGKGTLDQHIVALKGLTKRAKAGNSSYFHEAPRLTPSRRLDETSAARKPVLRWTAPAEGAVAFE